MATKKRSSQKRELITPRGDERYAKRDTKGQFKESDDVGKSLPVDRRTKAKRKVKPGFGDQGDQATRAAKKLPTRGTRKTAKKK